MPYGQKEFLKIKPGEVTGRVKVVSFDECGYVIFYVPSLNLSAYGKTPHSAERMMKEAVLPDFCRSLIDKPRVFVLSELEKLGWERDGAIEMEMSRNAHIDRESILREFNLDERTVLQDRELAIA